MSWREQLMIGVIALIVMAVVVTVVMSLRSGGDNGGHMVWSEEHQHYHREP